MKKIISVLMASVLGLSLSACTKAVPPVTTVPTPTEQTTSVPTPPPVPIPEPTPTDTTPIRVGALKGPTAMGMLELMNQSQAGTAKGNYTFTLAGAPDEIVAKVVKGELDIAAVPTNMSSVLYNKTAGKVQLAALNTLGVLYLVDSKDSIQSVADLKGKTIYATGKGATPEFALNYILAQNGLTVGTDVTVEYKTEHTELAGLLAAGQAELAILPQPFVSVALSQNPNLRIALDLTKEWDTATKGASVLTMGCIVVQQSFLEEHPAAVAQFMEEYKASTEYVTTPANLQAAAQLAEHFDVMKAPIAEKAIPQCNIVFITGEEMQKQASGFLQILFDANPQSVGGTLPDANFYYKQ